MQWVCSICGYIHDENEDAPETCPVCGAPASTFTEWYEDEDDLTADEHSNRKYDDADDDDYYGEFDE